MGDMSFAGKIRYVIVREHNRREDKNRVAIRGEHNREGKRAIAAARFGKTKDGGQFIRNAYLVVHLKGMVINRARPCKTINIVAAEIQSF